MADKKLSSVSAVSDMNFVYAETSSGETVKISKADLASVVAGLSPRDGISYRHLSSTVSSSSPYSFDVKKNKACLINLNYVYNDTNSVYLCTKGVIVKLCGNLPSAINVTISGYIVTITSSSGSYGLTAQVVDF